MSERGRFATCLPPRLVRSVRSPCARQCPGSSCAARGPDVGGDEVQAGQGVAAMEAMKMENELRAPAAGRVKVVHAAVGQAVEKGALLVEFEQP